MSHPDPHPLAGKSVTLTSAGDPALADATYRIEDWWDRVGGRSWMDAAANPACLMYAARCAVAGLPMDNEVVYGHVDGFGHLVHASELGEVVT